MATISAFGTRPIQSSYLPLSLAGGKAANAASASGNGVARLPVVEPVAPAADTISLAQQSLGPRVDQLGKGTLELAQQFLGNFARQLFGNAANGARVAFDTAALSAHTSVSATHSEGPDGNSDSAFVALSESAHFIGTGQVTTADGQSVAFEIEVHYEADVRASTQTTSRESGPGAPDLATLTGKSLPEIKFPGSLDDLFKLLGRELHESAPHNRHRPDQGENGQLSLRLLRLVNSAALLAPRARPDQAGAASAPDRSKALADSYGGKPLKPEIGVA